MDKTELFGNRLAVVNIGVKHFADALKAQDVKTAQVRWKPPADKKLADLLGRLYEMPDIREKIEQANSRALGFLLDGEPFWVGMKKVLDAVPGMQKNYILHSGPPIAWENMAPIHRKGHYRRHLARKAGLKRAGSAEAYGRRECQDLFRP